MSIDKRSDGPEPDRLEIKVTGAFGGEEVRELMRTQNVELTVRGTVVGHTFNDKYDKNGDRDSTTKVAVVKCDQLTALSIVPTIRQRPGQTSFDTGEGYEEDHGDLDGDGIVDAEVVELPRGQTPEGVDPETGEVNGDGYEDNEAEPEEEPEEQAQDEEDPDLEWR